MRFAYQSVVGTVEFVVEKMRHVVLVHPTPATAEEMLETEDLRDLSRVMIRAEFRNRETLAVIAAIAIAKSVPEKAMDSRQQHVVVSLE